MEKTKVTPAMIEKTKAMFSTIAKESVEVEFFGDHFAAYGSELATLRLYRKYNGASITQAWSENLKTFYFRLDTPMLGL